MNKKQKPTNDNINTANAHSELRMTVVQSGRVKLLSLRSLVSTQNLWQPVGDLFGRDLSLAIKQIQINTVTVSANIIL